MAVIEATREACPVLLKVILESGRLQEPELIGAAARELARRRRGLREDLDGQAAARRDAPRRGGDARAVRDHGVGGFKASGGIRTAEEAAAYLELADALFGPEWARPETFRFGASSLLGDLLRE